MIRFDWLEARGAAVALMTGVEDGDCGWGGCESGWRGLFLERAPFPSTSLTMLRQCHGDRIHRVGPDQVGLGALDRESALGDGDGLITNLPGVPLGINIADCVPLLICGGGVVAAVHAGRAGTELNIAGEATSAIWDAYSVHASALYAVVGPSAGPCCYQVGEEVLERATALGVCADGDRLDLWRTNRDQLEAAGVPGAHIQVTGRCTICGPGFYSYRERGTGERNLAVIMS